jgi:hypothetical protein
MPKSVTHVSSTRVGHVFASVSARACLPLSGALDAYSLTDHRSPVDQRSDSVRSDVPLERPRRVGLD